MTGLEVVGVVLGVVPLLITALEDYQELNRRRDAFFRRQVHIGRMVKALTEHQVLVEGDVEVLLRSTELGSNAIDKIKAGGCLELLKEKDIAEEVQALLGEKRYDTYLDTLRRCETNLFHIAREVRKFQQGQWIETGNLEDMLKINKPQCVQPEYGKRFKFTMAKGDLELAIRELDHSTEMLRKLRVLGLTINQHVQQPCSQRSTRTVKLLRKVRSQANLLYEAIASGWKDQCHDQHSAGLHLESRLSNLETAGTPRPPTKIPAISFKVTFEASAGSSQPFHHTSLVEANESDDGPNTTHSTRVQFVSTPEARPLVDLENICQAMSDENFAKQVAKIYLHHTKSFNTRTTLPRSHLWLAAGFL